MVALPALTAATRYVAAALSFAHRRAVQRLLTLATGFHYGHSVTPPI